MTICYGCGRAWGEGHTASCDGAIEVPWGGDQIMNTAPVADWIKDPVKALEDLHTLIKHPDLKPRPERRETYVVRKPPGADLESEALAAWIRRRVEDELEKHPEILKLDRGYGLEIVLGKPSHLPLDPSVVQVDIRIEARTNPQVFEVKL